VCHSPLSHMRALGALQSARLPHHRLYPVLPSFTQSPGYPVFPGPRRVCVCVCVFARPLAWRSLWCGSLSLDVASPLAGFCFQLPRPNALGVVCDDLGCSLAGGPPKCSTLEAGIVASLLIKPAIDLKSAGQRFSAPASQPPHLSVRHIVVSLVSYQNTEGQASSNPFHAVRRSR
jgi:hypothetical protein